MLELRLGLAVRARLQCEDQMAFRGRPLARERHCLLLVLEKRRRRGSARGEAVIAERELRIRFDGFSVLGVRVGEVELVGELQRLEVESPCLLRMRRDWNLGGARPRRRLGRVRRLDAPWLETADGQTSAAAIANVKLRLLMTSSCEMRECQKPRG